MLAALLAFMSVTGLAGMYNIKKLDPYLIPPDEIFAGVSAPFRLCVRNRKRYLPSFLVTLESASGESVTFPLVQKHSSTEAMVMLKFSHRGLVPVGLIKISSKYPVGFFTRYWTFDTGAEFMVFPALVAGGYSGSNEKSYCHYIQLDFPILTCSLNRRAT